MKITLVPKLNNEVEAFFKETTVDYANTIAEAYDLANDKALEIAVRQTKQLRTNKEVEMEVFSIFDELKSEPVGDIWISLNPQNKKVFIYQITIYQKNRGEGYGKAALKKLEEYCLKRTYFEIKLSVFMNNKVAFGLYQKMGYKVIRSEMKKTLRSNH